MKKLRNTQAVKKLKALTWNSQRPSIMFVKLLKRAGIQSVSEENLNQFAGTISQEDLEVMKEAIDKKIRNDRRIRI